MTHLTQLGLTDWELRQAELDELYSYDKNEPWYQRLVRVINQLINKTMRRHNLGHIMAANYANNPEIRQRHIDALWAEDDHQIVIRIK